MEQRQFDILQTLIAHPTVSPPRPQYRPVTTSNCNLARRHRF